MSRNVGEASRGDGHPHANFVAVRLSDDRRARGVRQVDARRVERRLEVFNDQAMQRVRSVGIRASGLEVSVHLLRSMAEEQVFCAYVVILGCCLS